MSANMLLSAKYLVDLLQPDDSYFILSFSSWSSPAWTPALHSPGKKKVQLLKLIVVKYFQEEPFTSYQPEALFNIARYLLHETKSTNPSGVSQLYPFHYVFTNLFHGTHISLLFSSTTTK